MARGKPQILQLDPESALTMVVDILDELINEIDDNLSNMEERFSGTERYSRLEEAKDAFEEQMSRVEDLLNEDTFETITGKREFKISGKKNKTKSERRSEAVAVLREFVDMAQTHSSTLEDDDDNKEGVDNVIETAEEVVDELEGIEL